MGDFRIHMHRMRCRICRKRYTNDITELVRASVIGPFVCGGVTFQSALRT